VKRAERTQSTGHVFQTPLGGPVASFLATEAFRSTRARAKVKATLQRSPPYRGDADAWGRC
jgi:hypothetical protein